LKNLKRVQFAFPQRNDEFHWVIWLVGILALYSFQCFNSAPGSPSGLQTPAPIACIPKAFFRDLARRKVNKLKLEVVVASVNRVELELTELNCMRNSAISMQDINSSLIVLLIYGTLYLQQSSLAPVWL